MANTTRTRTRTPGQATPTVTFKSKSDWARFHLNNGVKIAEIEKMSVNDPKSPGPMGYAFIYGVAKRAKLNLTAADRKKTAAVRNDPDSGIVTVRCDTGHVVTVDRATGKVKVIAPKS